MPRTKLDFHQSREDAADALSSLREVGLNSGDVGGAWLAETAADGPVEETPATATSRLVPVADVGDVRFSGWLAESALQALGEQETAPLSAIFHDQTLDADELARLRDTLKGGGGVVGVRARDTFGQNQD